MIQTNPEQEKLLDQYGELINPSKARIMRDAGLGIIETRRQGMSVWDKTDTRYLDLRDDAGVYNLGRRHPEVGRKLREAMDEFDLGNNLFFSEPRIRLAQKLGELSPQGALRAVNFGVSGGEIVDFAIKLARAKTKRKKVIAMEKGFYGCTGFAVTATSNQTFRDPFMPLIPDVIHVPFNDVSGLRKKIDRQTACVIVEPIQGHAGVILPGPEYLRAVRDLCDEYGALMICDEIQSGMGRTGKMFAVEHYRVIPDIMTIGKALSGGYFPITAALFRKDLIDYWEEYPFSHLSTFGGSDLGCITALATIEVMERENVLERVLHAEELFANAFEELKQKHPMFIKELRHKGLLMAVEFTDDHLGVEMSRALSTHGVLSPYTETNPKIMRLLPSLLIQDDEIQEIKDAFDMALSEVAAKKLGLHPKVARFIPGLHS